MKRAIRISLTLLLGLSITAGCGSGSGGGSGGGSAADGITYDTLDVCALMRSVGDVSSRYPDPAATLDAADGHLAG